MKESVLVVGGAGYIGSHVVLALKESNFRVIVLDNLSTGKRVNLFRDVTFYQGDMSRTQDLESIFQNENIGHVIHLAGLKAAGDSMTQPSQYAIHNLSGTLNLLDACLKAKVKSFVFSSSASVYGSPQYHPIDEQHPLNPENFYGFTKLEIERVLDWYLRLKGLRYACLRYFNAAGYDALGRVKGLESDTKNLVPLMMETAMGQRPFLHVFGTDYDTRDGSCIRDYIHVTDLAKAHVGALNFLENNDHLTCNLGTGTGTTVLEMIRSFESILGRKLTIKMVDRRAGDPPTLTASYEKAKRILGWEPEHSQIDHILKTSWSVYHCPENETNEQ